MSLAFFPYYPTDFDAKTAHLSFAEDGAYNRLLRLSWRCPSAKMPDDLEWIFRKSRAVTDADRALVTAIVLEFFTRRGGKIFNARLHAEWVKANASHSKRVANGKRGGAAKALKSNKSEASRAIAMLKPGSSNHNQNHKEETEGGDDSAGASLDPKNDVSQTAPNPTETDTQTDRERILAAIGLDPTGLTGRGSTMIGTPADMAEVNRWLALPGMSIETVIAEVASVMAQKADRRPPSNFRYFTNSMERLSGAISAPALIPKAGQLPNARGSPNSVSDLTAIWAQIEREAINEPASI